LWRNRIGPVDFARLQRRQPGPFGLALPCGNYRSVRSSIGWRPDVADLLGGPGYRECHLRSTGRAMPATRIPTDVTLRVLAAIRSECYATTLLSTPFHVFDGTVSKLRVSVVGGL
jgi:hypothetical protein